MQVPPYKEMAANVSPKVPPVYRSPYGPKYTIKPHYKGITMGKLTGNYAIGAGLFGGVAGFAALFFFSDVPKVRNDIMVHLPFIGPYFKKEVAPEDNPF